MPAARRTLDVSWLLRRPPHDHSGNREQQGLKRGGRFAWRPREGLERKHEKDRIAIISSFLRAPKPKNDRIPIIFPRLDGQARITRLEHERP
jgi:hypothetical protein